MNPLLLLGAIGFGKILSLVASSGIATGGAEIVQRKVMKSKKWRWALPALVFGINTANAAIATKYQVNLFGDDPSAMWGMTTAGTTGSYAIHGMAHAYAKRND